MKMHNFLGIRCERMEKSVYYIDTYIIVVVHVLLNDTVYTMRYTWKYAQDFIHSQLRLISLYYKEGKATTTTATNDDDTASAIAPNLKLLQMNTPTLDAPGSIPDARFPTWVQCYRTEQE